MKSFLKELLSKLILMMGFLALGSGCFYEPKKGPATGTVVFADLIQRVTVPGTVKANRKTIISAPYSGYIQKIYVHIGQRVQQGDPVVSLVQSLRKMSTDEVYPLRAPFSGAVVQILKTEGEYVEQGAGGAMVRIDDISHLFVEATVPEVEVDKLKENQEVVIKATALLGRTYEGRIRNIFQAAKEQSDWDRSKVEFTVLMDVLNPDGRLKPGMSVIVDITANKLTHVLTLKHEFIERDEDKYLVTMEDGTKKKIEVGIQNDEMFQIKSGLKEGERIQQIDFLSLLKGK